MKKYSLITKASSRHSSFRRKITTTVFIVALGVLLLYAVPQLVRFTSALFWMPYDSVRVWILESQSAIPVYLRDRQALNEELRELQSELSLLRTQDETFLKLEQENDELRELLGAVPESRVVARVLARPNQLPYDVLMIDRGANDGIFLHAPVFTGRDQVIGLVTRVLDKSAHVTLVTTPGFLATAYVYGPNIYTTTEGMGSGVLRVRVPQGIALNEEDIVVLPAIDSGVFGLITRVETSPTKPERYGYVIADTSLQSLQYVSVGREPAVTHSFVEAQEVVANTSIKLFTVDVPLESLVTPETFPAAGSAEGEEVSENVATSSATSSTP
ncbi:MAG: rod shape-determining protein MreC [Candidatus Paceibacteria bacterium]